MLRSILVGLLLAGSTPNPCVAHSAHVQEEEDNPETKSMSFDECMGVQQEYEEYYGKPEVILNLPQLRILKFSKNDDQEEVACDADGHTMTLLWPDGD